MDLQARHYPSYLGLLESGELDRRAAEAARLSSPCRICPRCCGAERMQGETGACRISGDALVACHFPHHGEEDCIRGRGGSGTVFFCGCNLLCSFCQNRDTSHECEGMPVTVRRLAEMMVELQEAGCHNINWVTPTHVMPRALQALSRAARDGLRLPIVYNTGGYDAVESLKLLDGVVDIYMPDFKFWDSRIAARYLRVADYAEVARRALREMHRQVGDLAIDDEGLARRGLLVRHLVLPGGLAGTRELAGWLVEEISAETFVNIMPQYRPTEAVLHAGPEAETAELARPLALREFREAVEQARAAGLRRLDGW